MQAIKLYNFPRSGHAHRVELMLSLLQLPTELIFVDLAKGAHKQPDFLALNAFGQVPVIDDQGVVLADSNAILVYLAQKYGNGRWLPADPVGAAKVQRWLSIAAGPIAFGPARARLITVFGAPYNAEEVIAYSHTVLKVIDQELAQRRIWLAPSRPLPTLRPTATSPMHRKAMCRWRTTPTSAPGWRGSKPCQGLSACRAPSPACKKLPDACGPTLSGRSHCADGAGEKSLWTVHPGTLARNSCRLMWALPSEWRCSVVR